MPKNSIFDLADKFGHTSPFGDWLAEEKEEREKHENKSLKIEFENYTSYYDEGYNRLNFKITSKNLNKNTAQIQIYEYDYLSPNDKVGPIRSVMIKPNGVSNISINITKKYFDEAWDNTFFLYAEITCGLISAQSGEIKLNDSTKINPDYYAKGDRQQLIDKIPKSNPIGNNLYILYIPRPYHNRLLAKVFFADKKPNFEAKKAKF